MTDERVLTLLQLQSTFNTRVANILTATDACIKAISDRQSNINDRVVTIFSTMDTVLRLQSSQISNINSQLVDFTKLFVGLLKKPDETEIIDEKEKTSKKRTRSSTAVTETDPQTNKKSKSAIKK